MSTEFTYEYLPWRGVQKEAFAFYDVKTKIDSEGRPVEIGFRYPNDSYKIRKLNGKEFYTRGDINKAGLFGRNKFAAGSHKYVTITEGELDALSLWQVLRNPVVSVQSSGTAHRDCSADRAWLNSFERVYLAFDADEPGRRACQEVAKLFDYDKVFHVKFSNRKDANEYVQAGEEEVLRNIWWNSGHYLPDNISSSLDDFKKILSKRPEWGTPYPWEGLNKILYGIRQGETVLFTAQEKVGKTELMHFIEHKLLKENPNANVGAIFLEEPQQRHLQALAGISLRKPVHLPDCDVGQDAVISALDTLVAKDDRLHIFNHFGSDDPDVVLDAIRFLVSARSCRFVILDHIGMVVSGNRGEDERRVLDYFSTRLEMMVKELNFALILVSHVNDEGKTRGSRYLTKVADVTISAERDLQAVDPVERNTVYLRVLYNRFSSTTGPACKLIFNRDTYSYLEEPWNETAANDNDRRDMGVAFRPAA